MGKDQELLEAARNGNILVVEKILNQRAKRSGPLASLRRGPGANVQDSSGYSALHHAALNGHKEIVELLLTHEASCNIADCKGSTPLHLASWSGNVDVVRLLLQHGPSVPDVNLTTKDNETALHWAAQYGHTAVVSQLLEHGCDPTIHNAREESALDLAAQYGRLEAVDLLVRTHPELIEPYSRGSGPPGLAYPHTPLHLASRNGHRAVVEVLLRAGVYVNILTGAGTALHEAALCGKLDVVRALLDAGVDLEIRDARRQTVLDLLGQFPEHVVRDIKYVIQRHRNGELQAEEDVELPPIPVPDTSVGSPYENVRTRSSTVGDISSSPASGGGPLRGENVPSWGGPPGSAEHHKRRTSATSAGSFTSENGIGCPVNIGRRVCEADQMSISSTASSNAGIYLPMSAPTGGSTAAESPGSKVSPTPPKKPPRRNLSVSPTHLMTMSVDGSTLVGHHHHHHHHHSHPPPHSSSSPSTGPYEYLCLARTGLTETSSANAQNLGRQRWQPHRQQQQQVQDQYVDMIIRQGNTSYENMIVVPPLRTQNPRRKLRRHPTSAAERELDAEPTYISSTYITLKSSSRESLLDEQRKLNQPPKLVCPLSPTNYQQPPTPDHPPPSAFQAENSIHERIRPLSQVNEQQEQQHEQQQQQSQEQEQKLEQSSPTTPPKSSPKESSPTTPPQSSPKESSPTIPPQSSSKESSPTIPPKSSPKESSPTTPPKSSPKETSPTTPPQSSPKDSVSDIDLSLELLDDSSVSSSSDDSGSSCDPISDNESKITTNNDTTTTINFSSLIV